MLPYTREIKVSGCNYSVSEWYPAYRDTQENLQLYLVQPSHMSVPCMPILGHHILILAVPESNITLSMSCMAFHHALFYLLISTPSARVADWATTLAVSFISLCSFITRPRYLYFCTVSKLTPFTLNWKALLGDFLFLNAQPVFLLCLILNPNFHTMLLESVTSAASLFLILPRYIISI